MIENRNWTVLLIGGASGIGKSCVAYALAKRYMVNVMEVDDVCQAIKAVTTKDQLPAVHYWSSGIDWMDVGVMGNVKWLTDVSRELIPGLTAIVDNHLEGDIPVIIEGDFMHPEFAASFNHPKIKKVFIHETEKDQVVRNYLAREGGDPQDYRAEISIEYSASLAEQCEKLGIPVVKARPFDSVTDRVVELLSKD